MKENSLRCPDGIKFFENGGPRTGIIINSNKTAEIPGIVVCVSITSPRQRHTAIHLTTKTEY